MGKIFRFPKLILKKSLFYLIFSGLVLFIIFFIATSLLIGKGVRDNCEKARSIYLGDCVEALIATLENENSSFSERNHAIWSLGQLGDERALPLLEKTYTGKIPEREPYDDGISQYELKKAIKLIESGFNATAFIWR